MTGNIGFSSAVYDLEDVNQGCGVAISAHVFVSNRWIGNTFTTANPTCVHYCPIRLGVTSPTILIIGGVEVFPGWSSPEAR